MITAAFKKIKEDNIMRIKEYAKKYAKRGLSIIPVCSHNHEDMNQEHRQKCKAPGKAPLIAGWPNQDVTNFSKIDLWWRKFPKANIGMVLGSRTGLVAIDIDGVSGEDILANWSQGDLPPTWEYITGHGRRLIYALPEGIIAKKVTRTDRERAHSECALMGDGQMIVMPPSIHYTGVTYEWKDGQAPWDLDPTPVPKWILQEVTRASGQENCNFPQKEEAIGSKAINFLQSKCARFAEGWKIQQAEGLDEETWFRWCACLVAAKCQKTAHRFSSASTKHNSRSEERVSQLTKAEVQRGMVRCLTMGCQEDAIRKCFKGAINLNNNMITNSPGTHIVRYRGQQKTDKASEALEDIGLSFSPKTGKLEFINNNIYARYLLTQFDLIYYSSGEQFYFYENGVYKLAEQNALSRILRDKLHQHVPDEWTSSLEAGYLAALKREATYVSELNSERGYINLTNGLLNLTTFELEAHRKDCYLTIRVPITYDPKAQCPIFKKFLNDIFGEDQECINAIGEFMGYATTADTQAAKALVLYGNGANGKSILCNVLMELCGKENVATVPLKDLENPFKRASLVGKIINLATENELGKCGLNTQFFKAIISSDMIDAEIKRGPSFSFQPICKLVFALNNLFYSADLSQGFFRRLLIIPFEREFIGEKADKGLFEKIKTELPGILNFALEGLKRLRNNNYNFTEPQKTKDVLIEYRKAIDPVFEFVSESIQRAPAHQTIKNDVLHDAFRSWCFKNGHKGSADIGKRKLTERFKQVLKDCRIPYDVGMSNGKRYISGISFILDSPEVLEPEEVADLDMVG